MTTSSEHVVALLARLTPDDHVYLRNSVAKAQAIENRWERKIREAMHAQTLIIVRALTNFESIPDFSFEDLFIQHAFESAIAGYSVARQPVRLARKPPNPTPNTSLKRLMKYYDLWRKGQYKPKRPAYQANQIKKDYLKKVHNVWVKHSEEFRKGNTYDQEEVVRQIKKEADTTTKRAQGIVRTETTNYYNQSRMNYYDESQDVTHYLFMAIRDNATSPWCSPKTVDGKRGRHGLVYKKGDPLLVRERPACHPWCRSELLPLTPENATHAKLINDKSIQRRNVQCYPLLRSWGTR